jgi:cell division protein FtsW (lipid II flippase)
MQTNLGYVPEQYTDFIFTAIGEQLGFIGSALIILLLAFIGLRMFVHRAHRQGSRWVAFCAWGSSSSSPSAASRTSA